MQYRTNSDVSSPRPAERPQDSPSNEKSVQPTSAIADTGKMNLDQILSLIMVESEWKTAWDHCDSEFNRVVELLNEDHTLVEAKAKLKAVEAMVSELRAARMRGMFLLRRLSSISDDRDSSHRLVRKQVTETNKRLAILENMIPKLTRIAHEENLQVSLSEVEEDAASVLALPDEWTEHHHPITGYKYYYNSLTDETQWVHPATTQSCQPPVPEEPINDEAVREAVDEFKKKQGDRFARIFAVDSQIARNVSLMHISANAKKLVENLTERRKLVNSVIADARETAGELPMGSSSKWKFFDTVEGDFESANEFEKAWSTLLQDWNYMCDASREMVDKYSKHPSRAVVKDAKDKCQESLKNSSSVVEALVAYQPEYKRNGLDEGVRILTNNVEILEKQLAALDVPADPVDTKPAPAPVGAEPVNDPVDRVVEWEVDPNIPDEFAVLRRRLVQTDAQSVTLCGAGIMIVGFLTYKLFKWWNSKPQQSDDSAPDSEEP